MITGTFTTAVGDITVQMDDGGAQAYVDVSKLGNLKYEFDQTPDSVQIDRTIALYSYIQVVYEGLTDSSEDLYTRLIDATATSAIDCTLSIDNFGVDTFEFSFELKQENIDFDEKTGEVSVRFTPKIDKEVTISEVVRSGTNYQYRPLERTGDAPPLSDTNLNCLPVIDFLDKGMQEVFNNSYEAYIKPSKTSSNVSYFKSNASWSNDDPGYVIVDNGDVVFPITANVYGEPQELSITANVTANTVYTLSSIDVIAGTQDVAKTTTYIIEATDILDQFPVGSAAGWPIGDQTIGPYRINRTASTQNVVKTVPNFEFLIDQTYTGTAPPNTNTAVANGGRIFSYTPAVNTKVADAIKEIAGIEGSIYGTGFSKNFYVHRLSDNDTEYITLKYDNVSDIKQKKLNKYLRGLVVRQLADYDNSGFDQFGQVETTSEQSIRLPNLKGAGAFVRGNESATKSMEINLAPVYPYLNKASKLSDNYISLSLASVATETTLERAITSAGVRSYAQSLSQESGGLKIEFTYIDALALRPYEVFQFDSTAPEKYQNIQYRITSISYDFVKNECKVVGYQISGLSTPIVTQPVAPPPNDPDDGNEGEGDNEETTLNRKYKPGWNFISNPTQGTDDAEDVFGDDYVESSLYEFVAGTYINDGTTNIRTSNTNAAVNDRSPGYAIRLRDTITPTGKYYSWPGEVNASNVTNIQVYQGWNLIGSLGVPAVLQSNTVNGADIPTDGVYRFDGSYITTGTLILPGFSHWVVSSNNGAVDLIVSPDNALPTNLQNEFKQVEISEGSLRQSVYFDGTNTNTNVNIQQFQFPPAVGANFDVRINQDETNTALRDLRAVESNTINIDVQQIDSATTLNISPSIFYYVAGATDASPSHTTNVYTSLSGYSLACSCSIYEAGSLYYTTGPAATSYFQATFLDGDKIITAQNVAEGTPVDVPITTTRITLQPMPATIKLPVRAKDIANDDGELLDTVAIEGTSGSVSDRIQYLNSTGKITRIETTEDAPEFRPVKNLQLSLASYDDYALPTGTLFGVIGITSPYSVTFTGFRDEGGREVTFISRPNVTITFNHEDSNSDADHRFVLPNSSNVTISEYQTATFVYVTSESRWYMISKT